VREVRGEREREPYLYLLGSSGRGLAVVPELDEANASRLIEHDEDCIGVAAVAVTGKRSSGRGGESIGRGERSKPHEQIVEAVVLRMDQVLQTTSIISSLSDLWQIVHIPSAAEK
jgi:hypothetical protein